MQEKQSIKGARGQFALPEVLSTPRPYISSFLGLPYRTLYETQKGTTMGPWGTYDSPKDWSVLRKPPVPIGIHFKTV